MFLSVALEVSAQGRRRRGARRGGRQRRAAPPRLSGGGQTRGTPRHPHRAAPGRQGRGGGGTEGPGETIVVHGVQRVRPGARCRRADRGGGHPPGPARRRDSPAAGTSAAPQAKPPGRRRCGQVVAGRPGLDGRTGRAGEPARRRRRPARAASARARSGQNHAGLRPVHPAAGLRRRRQPAADRRRHRLPREHAGSRISGRSTAPVVSVYTVYKRRLERGDREPRDGDDRRCGRRHRGHPADHLAEPERALVGVDRVRGRARSGSGDVGRARRRVARSSAGCPTAPTRRWCARSTPTPRRSCGSA